MKKFLLSCFILCFVAVIAGCTNCFKWKYDYLVLVNKQHKLPADWESKVELVEVKNAFDEDIKVEKEAYEKYLELRDALLEEWVDIELDSVYRSVNRQEELWHEFEEEYWIDYTKKYVAVPWYSEHHTALAIDICIKKDWELIYENDDMIAEKEIFDKIHAKLADYGFILRYLEWKEDITGYGYEPWHLRYVGDVKVAKEIMDKWLTLEEYLGEVENVEDENVDIELPEWAKTSLSNKELEEVINTHFPKWYAYSLYNTETEESSEWEYTYPEDLDHSLLLPIHATMASREILSSTIEDGMIYTNTKVTLQDNTEVNILYIVNPETLDFVAANVENGNEITNYQFVY